MSNVEDLFLSGTWYPFIHGVWSGWIQVLIPVFNRQAVLALVFVIAGRNAAWLTVINKCPVMTPGIHLLVSVFNRQAALALVFVIAVRPAAWSAVIHKFPVMTHCGKYIVILFAASAADIPFAPVVSAVRRAAAIGLPIMTESREYIIIFFPAS